MRRDGDEVNGPLQSVWYRLTLEGLPRGVVVVDATPSAAALWFGPVASILEEIVEKLPPEMHPEVAFLGDRKTHSLDTVIRSLAPGPATGAAIEIPSQLGRYPVLGPLLWELSRGPARPLLVLANSPILDLEDWAAPEYAGRTLVYRMMGSEPLSHPSFREVGPETDLAVLVEHLHDPIASLRIGHPSALAMDWSNDTFRWEDGMLHGTATANLIAQFLHPHEGQPEALVTKQSGIEHRLTLAAAPPPEAPTRIPLSPAEGNVLNLWRRGSGFWCGHCSRTHAPGQVWCRGSGNPTGLFPSFATLNALAYLSECRDGVWFAMPVHRGITPISDRAVSITRSGAVAEYHFEDRHWLAVVGDPGTFLALDDSRFLIRCGPRS